MAALLCLLLAQLVELVDLLKHVDRGLTGVELMLLVVDRRVPERHDGVAHIFVDGTLARQDCIGQRGQEPVHQFGQALRVVLVGFRDGGEAADVGEHDGHLALFAAKHELFRRLRELFDQGRREILTECRADLPALRLLADVARENQREVDRRRRQQRIGEVDELPVMHIEKPGSPDQHGREQRADNHQRGRPEVRRERDHQEAEQKGAKKFVSEAVARLRDHRAGQRAFQHLRMNLDARHHGRHWRGLDVDQPGGGGSDQHQLAGDLVLRNAPLQDVDGRDVDRWVMMRVMYPELRVGVGRDLKVLHADALDAVLFGLDEDGAGAARDPQHLETQRRHAHALGLHDHRHAADDAVALRHDGEEAAAGRGFFQHRHVTQQSRKLEDETLRVLAEHGESRDGKLRVEIGVNVGSAGLTQDHARFADHVGEDLVVARQRLEFFPRRLVEITEGVGGNIRIEPVRLGEQRVEGDHDGAEPGQIVDDIGKPGARPRPLAQPGISEAPFIDVDDGDGTRGLHAWVDDLKGIERPDTELLDRGRIGDAQHREADQERKAHQPRVAELPREPPSQYPQALHAIQISRPGGLITFSLLGWRRALAMENEVAGVQVGGNHVLQQDGVIGVERDQRVVALLGFSRKGRSRDGVELPDIDLVEIDVEIRDRMLRGTR